MGEPKRNERTEVGSDETEMSRRRSRVRELDVDGPVIHTGKSRSNKPHEVSTVDFGIDCTSDPAITPNADSYLILNLPSFLS